MTDAPTSVSFNALAGVARLSFLCERHAYCIGAGIASGIVSVEREDREMGGQRHDILFLLEPSLTWYVDVTSFLRLAVDVGYRYVRGGGQDIAPSDVRGVTTSFTTQIGWF